MKLYSAAFCRNKEFKNAEPKRTSKSDVQMNLFMEMEEDFLAKWSSLVGGEEMATLGLISRLKIYFKP